MMLTFSVFVKARLRSTYNKIKINTNEVLKHIHSKNYSKSFSYISF